MKEILDVHSHRAYPEGVDSLSVVKLSEEITSARENIFVDDCPYSIGIHPWDAVVAPKEEYYQLLDTLAQRQEIVAIGEVGLDAMKGGPMFRQLNIFRNQIELSEKVGKPLIIHDVKAHELVIELKKEYKPVQNWVIHGFRYKPEVAGMMTSRGIYLSFGPQYNQQTLQSMPRELILAETDDKADITINEVVESIGRTLGMTFEDVRRLIAENTRRFLTSL